MNGQMIFNRAATIRGLVTEIELVLEECDVPSAFLREIEESLKEIDGESTMIQMEAKGI